MNPIYGFRALASHAGVSRTTAHRDYLAGVLNVDEWVSGRRNRPMACFHQPTADSYRSYRAEMAKPVSSSSRLTLIIGPDLQAALDEAYRKGYNAGRRARQRESAYQTEAHYND